MSSRDIKNVDLNLLVVLDVLLEERNVSRAARRLALTQSTVSGMLSRLRDALGDPLFVRARHGIRPTPRAEAMTAPLRRWLDDARALVAPAEFDPAHWRGAFAISSTDYMQETLLRPASFASSARRRPGCGSRWRRSWSTGSPRSSRRRRSTWPSRSRSSRLQVSCRAGSIATSTSSRCAARILSRGAGSSSLDDFCRFEHVLVSPTGGAFTGPADAALARLGRERRVRTSVPTFLLVPAMLEAEDLLAVLPRHLVAGRSGRLRLRPPPFAIPGFDVVAVWHSRVHDDPAHRWLRGRLAQTARRLG